MTAPPSAGCFTEPARPLTFTFEGRTITAIEGQSIAAALYAAGVRIFSRSFKYHRPRGLLCVAGDCPNCLMRVDDRPNVRTCIEPARAGQVVSGQNAWPGLRFDVLRVFDPFARFLPVGFYYKHFHKPRWLWPIFERVVRQIAGLGHIDVRTTEQLETAVEHLSCEVCIIGAGPAGVSAAAAAAEAGADALLLERQPRWGGHLLYEAESPEVVEQLARVLHNHAGRMHVLLDTTAFGVYEGNLVAAVQRQKLLKIRAGQVIVCTGARQRPMLFGNNDLPGIFLGEGALRLARLYGVHAGRRAVVATDNDGGHRLADQLACLGIEIAAVVDARPAADGGTHAYAVLPEQRVLRARGRTHLRAVDVALVAAAAGGMQSSARTIACDLLCIAPGLVPAQELLRQGGMRFTYQGGCWLPGRAPSGLLAAGRAAGTFELEAQLHEGRRRGREAAASIGYATAPEAERLPVKTTGLSLSRIDDPRATEFGKCFVCLCEDVTAKDLQQAVAEGFDHIETLKRYATVGMGPCQGKMCGQTSSEGCARLLDKDVAEVGTTTSRPPLLPVELALLAAERRHHPVRRTPLHEWHCAAGARFLDAGQWKRPESYGDPTAEVRTVRSTVGLIDVSTLGKLEVVGPDAATLLERVYLNRWADLGVARARYGVLCTEDGVVFDDGVGARLGPDHFFLTATTGNAEAVYQWLELWRATWRLDAVVLNQTSALAAMNLAGPQARAVLARLTTLDLSSAAFPYPSLREGEVAGVSCRLLRIGFVGELGYEIHCTSAHGWHLWEALTQAGADFGLKPFGVEAQRILRLEKGHLIVGQDTDALADPFGAGLERLVRFDKPQFHGREPLLRLKGLGPRSRLVGFHISSAAAPHADPGWARELEGCQVTEHGQPAGRVTSARYSPILERYVGLAWLPTPRASAGDRFLIRCDSRDVPALVTPIPFYDPEGKRLKS
jgi:sarcosine oxidase subunit alpha